MTELLFLEDSYLVNFNARVVKVDEESKAIVLDQTAFYPGGGGQPSDQGKLSTSENTYTVSKVKKISGEVYHFIEDEMLPEVGTELTGDIDWDRRHKLMRTHTAMHVLCGVVFRDYGAQVTGGSMDPLRGRMDFEFETMQQELVKEIEETINAEGKLGHDVTTRILPREEAFAIPDLIRTKINLLPESISEVRVVEIVGLDLQADGGTHVRNTSEIGPMKIANYKSKGKINKRIYLELMD